MRSLNIDGDEFVFDTLEQLVNMLKEEDYEVNLNIEKKSKVRRIKINL